MSKKVTAELGAEIAESACNDDGAAHGLSSLGAVNSRLAWDSSDGTLGIVRTYPYFLLLPRKATTPDPTHAWPPKLF